MCVVLILDRYNLEFYDNHSNPSDGMMSGCIRGVLRLSGALTTCLCCPLAIVGVGFPSRSLADTILWSVSPTLAHGNCLGLCILSTVFLAGTIVNVPQGFVSAVTKFGKYSHIVGPGTYAFNPCIEKFINCDMKTQTITVDHQQVFAPPLSPPLISPHLKLQVPCV